MSKERVRGTTQAERVRTSSHERRARAKQDVRLAILEAAAALFVEYGYEQFSLRQVAEQVGYSATTIYLYFTDKDDLLFTVADQGFQRFGAALATAAASSSQPSKQLQAIGQAYVQFGLTYPAYYQLMFMQRGDFLMAKQRGETSRRIDSLGILQELVQVALGATNNDSSQAWADALWAVVHGIVALHISMPVIDRGRAEAAAAIAIEHIVTGLQSD